MLALPAIGFQWFPQSQFMREALTFRTMIAGAVLLMIASFALIAALPSAIPSCSADQSLLLYPLYGNKGTIVDHVYRCGVKHRGCTPLQSEAHGAQFECSPFMAPTPIR